MRYLADQVLNGLSLGCVYALLAIGFAMVFGVLKLLNFAHSEIFATGAFIGYFALRWLTPDFAGSPLLLLLAAIMIAGSGAGVLAMIIEKVAYRPLRDYRGEGVLLTAIGVSIAIQNIGIQFFSAHARGYPPLELPFPPKAVAVVILVLSFLLLYGLIHWTSLGLEVRAIAEDLSTSRLLGISPPRLVTLTFFVGGFFAGVAGVVWGIVYGVIHLQMGFYPGLKSFIIAVIGSIGDLPGTFVAGIGLGLLECLLAAYLPPPISAYRDPLTLSLLLALLVWKPHGILGSSEPEKV